VEPVEGMALVFDAAIHMRTAALARISLDHRRGVNDLQLVAVFEHRHVLARYDRDDGEGCALRLPAFRAAARMIMRDVALDADLDRPVSAFADQRSAAEVAGALLHAAVDRWMELNVHGPILLGMYVLPKA